MVRGVPATTDSSEVCARMAIWSASDGITRKETCEEREEGVMKRSLFISLSLALFLAFALSCSLFLALS